MKSYSFTAGASRVAIAALLAAALLAGGPALMGVPAFAASSGEDTTPDIVPSAWACDGTGCWCESTADCQELLTYYPECGDWEFVPETGTMYCDLPDYYFPETGDDPPDDPLTRSPTRSRRPRAATRRIGARPGSGDRPRRSARRLGRGDRRSRDAGGTRIARRPAGADPARRHRSRRRPAPRGSSGNRRSGTGTWRVDRHRRRRR